MKTSANFVKKGLILASAIILGGMIPVARPSVLNLPGSVVYAEENIVRVYYGHEGDTKATLIEVNIADNPNATVGDYLPLSKVGSELVHIVDNDAMLWIYNPKMEWDDRSNLLSKYKSIYGEYTRVHPNSGTETKPDANAGTETKPGANVGVETKPDANTGVETKPGANAGTETKPDANVGSETKPGANAGTETKPDANAGAETKSDANAGVEIKPNANAGITTTSKVEVVQNLTTGQEQRERTQSSKNTASKASLPQTGESKSVLAIIGAGLFAFTAMLGFSATGKRRSR